MIFSSAKLGAKCVNHKLFDIKFLGVLQCNFCHKAHEYKDLCPHCNVLRY
jgi:hypothetical protein